MTNENKSLEDTLTEEFKVLFCNNPFHPLSDISCILRVLANHAINKIVLKGIKHE